MGKNIMYKTLKKFKMGISCLTFLFTINHLPIYAMKMQTLASVGDSIHAFTSGGSAAKETKRKPRNRKKKDSAVIAKHGIEPSSSTARSLPKTHAMAAAAGSVSAAEDVQEPEFEGAASATKAAKPKHRSRKKRGGDGVVAKKDVVPAVEKESQLMEETHAMAAAGGSALDIVAIQTPEFGGDAAAAKLKPHRHSGTVGGRKQYIGAAAVAEKPEDDLCAGAASLDLCRTSQKINLDQLLIVNKLEIERLAKKYRKPIIIEGGPISSVKITKKLLEHVFGISIMQKKTGLRDLNMAGFHHDYHLELEDLIKPYYVSGHSAGAGISEGFIAYKQNQFPVFKTFFSHMLTREEVIEKLIESLQNIESYVDEGGKNLEITGKASVIRREAHEDIIIKTVVNKETKDIITFFPVTQKPEEEIKQEKQKLNLLFKKFNFNIENKPERQPITEKEIEQLLDLYSDGIEVNWVIIRDNLLFNEKFAKKALSGLNPLYNQTPKHIKKINITPKSLENIFAENNDGAFPKYLSRVEILEKLKEALQNITIYDAGLGASIRRKDIRVGSFEGIGNFIKLKSFTNGKDRKDIWELFIVINEDTGDLEIFYPLFG